MDRHTSPSLLVFTCCDIAKDLLIVAHIRAWITQISYISHQLRTL